MKPLRAKTPGKLGRSVSRDSLQRAPVCVFCRVRGPPMCAPSALEVCPGGILRLRPPIGRATPGHTPTAMCYSFREVFDAIATQNEVFTKVAFPLVENLIRGKNGLLFAYGVTGSGKTYTMTGEHEQPGILPRCLDALFLSVGAAQARRLAIVPDKGNTFRVQGEGQPRLPHQMMYPNTRRNNSNPDLAVSSSEALKIDGLDEDCLYAVFVTYIEIYNNIVYDLLEEGTIGKRSPQTKIVREDADHKMYVHGVTEVEVKTREEALQAFYQGLKRKRMAHTSLNAGSSRSHSVFTIRLVQVPVDSEGESLVQDPGKISVRQLSLVDLAGSERTSRTNNTGQRLREAGNINNSLMTLRSCLEALRENQQAGCAVGGGGAQPRVVPYRDAKLTHLFKNFFEGEGHVRMLVCVNPASDDYDETLQVMRFAEVAMEVEVPRPKPQLDLNAGMTPGRRKANHIFKQARAKILAEGVDEKELAVDLALVYSLGGDFPSLELGTQRAEELLDSIAAHLRARLGRRQPLLRNKANRDGIFRKQLEELTVSHQLRLSEVESLRAQLQRERERARALEARLLSCEEDNHRFRGQLASREAQQQALQQQLNDKNLQLNQKELEKQSQKKRYISTMAKEQEKNTKELENVLRMQREKIKKAQASAAEVERQENKEVQGAEGTASKRGFAVSNPRHRRSMSVDEGHGARWLQHTPRPFVPMGTALQPRLPQHPTHNINIQDITNSKVSNYCLLSQEQDTDGELETKVYKGDIVPTCGGGAQVIFRDVEMLKQSGMAKKREGADHNSENKKPRM